MSVWEERARTVADARAVNTPNFLQRELELDAIEPYLSSDLHVLEVGCGNGWTSAWLAERVARVTAIDVSDEMILRARREHPDSRIDFRTGDIRTGDGLSRPSWDLILCIRVLINLTNLDEQRAALAVLARHLTSDGRLILAEGFLDGFLAINELRQAAGEDPIIPAPINCYSTLADLAEALPAELEVEGRFHLGAFDYLTRIAGCDPELAVRLARAYNPAELERFSRLRGFVLRRA